MFTSCCCVIISLNCLQPLLSYNQRNLGELLLTYVAAIEQSLYNIIPEFLPAHALSGCDTVAIFNGFGKAKMLKLYRQTSIVLVY